jgi:hypothetical protein
LACHWESEWKTPLTESDVRRLYLDDQPVVSYCDYLQRRQAREQTSVSLSSEYQEFLRRRVEVVEQSSMRGPIVFLDTQNATRPQSSELGELRR